MLPLWTSSKVFRCSTSSCPLLQAWSPRQQLLRLQAGNMAELWGQDPLRSFKCWIIKYHGKLWKKMAAGNCAESCVSALSFWSTHLRASWRKNNEAGERKYVAISEIAAMFLLLSEHSKFRLNNNMAINNNYVAFKNHCLDTTFEKVTPV